MLGKIEGIFCARLVARRLFPLFFLSNICSQKNKQELKSGEIKRAEEHDHFFARTRRDPEEIRLTASDQTHGAPKSLGELAEIRAGHKRPARVLYFTQHPADQGPGIKVGLTLTSLRTSQRNTPNKVLARTSVHPPTLTPRSKETQLRGMFSRVDGGLTSSSVPLANLKVQLHHHQK